MAHVSDLHVGHSGSWTEGPRLWPSRFIDPGWIGWWSPATLPMKCAGFGTLQDPDPSHFPGVTTGRDGAAGGSARPSRNAPGKILSRPTPSSRPAAHEDSTAVAFLAR